VHANHVARAATRAQITPATPAIAASGVDLISACWLTHSAQLLDIGLDWGGSRAATNLAA
jgi:nicotinate-nucleotide pyrophosphorylase (carboxylating)